MLKWNTLGLGAKKERARVTHFTSWDERAVEGRRSLSKRLRDEPEQVAKRHKRRLELAKSASAVFETTERSFLQKEDKRKEQTKRWEGEKKSLLKGSF